MKDFWPIKGERANTWTHLVGSVAALASIWMAWPAIHNSWQMGFGVIVFLVGMFFVFTSSTIYHWVHPGKAKRALRHCDHISIYVMIAASYTPICVGVVGGWAGWTLFGVQWGIALVGGIVKMFALGKYPKLSLAVYLIMGWSIVFVAPAIISKLSVTAWVLLLCEGVMYTVGTYFFAKDDDHENYHAIWHVFVLLGAMFHWLAVLTFLV